MNTAASRAAALALLFLGTLVVTAGPAAARRDPVDEAPPMPTATPIYFPMTAPSTNPNASGVVATAQPALMASSVCQNDRFLAQRAVPAPQRFEVSVCGLVWALSPGGFQIAIDGTRLIPVSGKDAGSVQVGESVLVVGTYRNTAASTESIDATGGVSPLPAMIAPTS